SNSIRGNSIFSNGGLGIDLGPDGPTINDDCDADSGSNNLQNFPVLSQAVNANSSTFVLGTINSSPNTTLSLDFYASLTPDPSGFGEGQTYVGSRSVTTSQNCSVSFNFSFAQIPLGQYISATATDAVGNTSEFSVSAQVTLPTAAPGSISGRLTTSDGSP